MLTYGILADVHGNLDALQAVLGFLMERGVERFACLGGVVGYCASPNECVSLLESLSVAGVVGNHDLTALGRRGFDPGDAAMELSLRRTRRRLTARSRAFLASLPFSRALGDGIMMISGAAAKASPSESLASRLIEEKKRFTERICLFGHHPAPALLEVDGDFVRERETGPRIDLPGGGRTFFIHPGAVDASRRSPKRQAECAIFDAERQRVEFHQVPYDDGHAERYADREGFRMTAAEEWEIRTRWAAESTGKTLVVGIRALLASA